MSRRGLALLLLPGCMSSSTTLRESAPRVVERRGEPEVSSSLRVEPVDGKPGVFRVGREARCPRLRIEEQDRWEVTEKRPGLGAWIVVVFSTLGFLSARRSEDRISSAVLGGSMLGLHLALSGTSERRLPSEERELGRSWERCLARPQAGVDVHARTGNTAVHGVTDEWGRVRLGPSPGPDTVFFVGGSWVATSSRPAPPPAPVGPPSPPTPGPRHGGFVVP